MRRLILPYNAHLKPLANKLRKDMTLSEVLLWNQVKNKQMEGVDFDRQKPILNYIVDFYCKDLMLAIEIDGNSHHFKESEDYHRQRELEKLGIYVLRFDDMEVKTDIENVLREIRYTILKLKERLF
jgi:very-short-patch-repair endonuclease